MTAPRVANDRWMIQTHRDPDLDDIEAIRLLKKYGGERYPGIERAKIVTLSQREHLKSTTPEELESRKILCVGIAGSKLDEHPVNGSERKLNDCATTLVAKDLDIDEIPWLQANIDYAFHCNYYLASSEFELGPLVKLAFRYLSHSGEREKDLLTEVQIFDAAFAFLNAIEASEENRLYRRKAPSTATRSMDELIAFWLLKKFGDQTTTGILEVAKTAQDMKTSISHAVAGRLGILDDPALKRLIAYANDNRKPGVCREERQFELASLVGLVQTQFPAGGDHELAHYTLSSMVDIFLNAFYAQKIGFLACGQDYQAATTRTATITGKDKKLVRIVSVVSKNPEIAKYCRSKFGGKAQVVIIRHPETGNTGIFFDKKSGVDPKPVLAGIRTAEREANGRKMALAYEALVAEGEVSGAEVWFYDRHNIMNGSFTIDRPATKLSRERIEGIVQDGLRANGRRN